MSSIRIDGGSDHVVVDLDQSCTCIEADLERQSRKKGLFDAFFHFEMMHSTCVLVVWVSAAGLITKPKLFYHFDTIAKCNTRRRVDGETRGQNIDEIADFIEQCFPLLKVLK